MDETNSEEERERILERISYEGHLNLHRDIIASNSFATFDPAAGYTESDDRFYFGLVYLN